MRKLLKLVGFLLLFLIIVIAVKTFLFHSKQSAPFGERKVFPVDTSVIHHLSDAVQIQTIGIEGKPIDTAAFNRLRNFLFSTYPEVVSACEPVSFPGGGLLLKLRGKNPQLKPVILYAHMDVVPVDSGWSFNAFEGKTDNQFIYGRGVIDDKGAVISIFESLRQLIASKQSPKRDIYFVFGSDEETGGRNGTAEIAQYLRDKNVKAEFFLDEGGIIADGMVPFVSRPVALIATAEKGYVCFRLTVNSTGGHSSMPPKNPPAERLAEAISKIHQHPLPTRLTTPLSDFINYVGPEMKFPFKSLFANSWLFRPLIFSEYEKIPGANAMIRTTAVTTMLSGGIKENTIPQKVSAVVNYRLLQGDDAKSILEKLKTLLNDSSIQIEQMDAADQPSAIASTEAEGFKLIDKTIREVFPDVIVTPNLSTGGTDSKHFRDLTDNIYRFLPTRMNQEILDGMHGKNEKMEIRSFMEMIAFYRSLIGSL